MDHKEPVVVYTTTNAGEAEVIRIALEAQGITCFINDETQGGFTGIMNDVTLIVPADQAEEAKRIIELTQPTSPDATAE